VAERPAPPRTDHLPPFKVLLHNDDVNDAEHVVRSLVAHTPLSVARAIDVMTEAHNTGVALVVTTHQELAELYQGQLQSLGLTSTIEPA
jgi:ATP-dependent Clp protease adaptor protein ClpS